MFSSVLKKICHILDLGLLGHYHHVSLSSLVLTDCLLIYYLSLQCVKILHGVLWHAFPVTNCLLCHLIVRTQISGGSMITSDHHMSFPQVKHHFWKRHVNGICLFSQSVHVLLGTLECSTLINNWVWYFNFSSVIFCLFCILY